jgi:hypothetical protein
MWWFRPKRPPRSARGFIRCSFCLLEHEAKRGAGVAGGTDGFICKDCIAVAIGAIAEQDQEWRDRQREVLKALAAGAEGGDAPLRSG